MKQGRRQHTAEFKSRVVLEALREAMTTTELAVKYEVHSTQIVKWKKQFTDSLPALFGLAGERREREVAEEKERLLKKVGQLQMEVDWLKKKFPL